jgi:uncharacterized membrane protein YhhN
MVSKPLIMASLIGFYIGNVTKQSPLFILAMIFALLGDIFLMFKDETFFLIGLGSFMLMQILYAITFLKDKGPEMQKNILKSVPVITIAVIIMFFLWDKLGSMQIPVAVYTAAISGMVISALIRNTSVKWYLPVVVGVILFMVSDAGIAVNKFGNNFAYADYFIMSTYMIAQYLIVRGVAERDVDVQSIVH